LALKWPEQQYYRCTYFTSSDVCQCTTVWNTDAPNCYVAFDYLCQIDHLCIINL